MESFSKIASGRTYVVYSTHSHYMVNPIWLNKAYIIDNSAVNYDGELDVDFFSGRKTDIKAIPYRQFVASHPNMTSYFQPVIDALEVKISPLMQSSKALIVEGKNDYYPVLYLANRFAKIKEFQIFPAHGADNVKRLISLFRGWGVKFLVMIDDDKAGQKSKSRHISECNMLPDEIITLSDIDPSFEGCCFEELYKSDVQGAARIYCSCTELTKSHYSLYFQHLIVNEVVVAFSKTDPNFRRIANKLSLYFK